MARPGQILKTLFSLAAPMLDVDTNPAATTDDMNILVVGSRSSRCLVICVILAPHIELHFTRENILLRCVVSMLGNLSFTF